MLVDSPVPGVSGYEQANNAAKLAYQQAQSRIGLKRSNLLRNYGYTADFDPTSGSMSNMRVDTNNQFGGLQQMLGGHAQEDMNVRQNDVSRGIHGGLANQDQSEARLAHQAQDVQFGTQVANDMAGTANEWQDATTDYNNTLYQVQQQAARDAIDQQRFNASQTSFQDLQNAIGDMAGGYGDLANMMVSGFDGLGQGLDGMSQQFGQNFGKLQSSLSDGFDSLGNKVSDLYPGYLMGGNDSITTNRSTGAYPGYTPTPQAAAINSASSAALAKAKSVGSSPAAAALAARSAGLNAKYGIGSAPKPAPAPSKPAAVVKNAYTSGQKKRG